MRYTFRLSAAVLLLLAAPLMVAHLRNETQPGGLPLVRTDVTNIEYLVNDQTAAGMTNTDGQAIITAGSDPIGALRASLATWNAIPSSAIRFADLQTTNLTDDGNDRRHVFIFTDTPEHRARTGGALAVTSTFFSPATGELSDTDIIFNPTEKFSTDLTAGTFDLESTTTHELGHALGADHTNFFGATMYQSGPPANNLQATLSTDDIGFATAAYPAPGQAGNFGTLTGTVTRAGQGVPGAFVTAIDVNNFTHVSGLTEVAPAGASRFTYTIDGVPPGTYMVYVEPLDGPVFPGNVGLPDLLVESDFHTTAAGSFAAPTTVMVAGGGVTTLDVAVETGPSAIDIDVFGMGSAGGQGDAGFGRGFRRLTPGEATDLMVWGEGIDVSITENDIHLLANGVTLRSGSLRIDPLININGRDPIRFTVDVAANAPNGIGTVVIAKDGDAAAWSGGLIIRGAGGGGPPPNFSAAGLVNAASFTAGALPPDAWADLFGTNFASKFTLDSSFPTSIDGVSMMITDGAGTTHNVRLHFVTPDRIQFLTPPAMAPGQGSLKVTNTGGQSASTAITIAPVRPGFFSANASGQGPAAATLLFIDGAGNRTDGFTFTLDNPRANAPINLGSATDSVFLAFFGTGFRNQQSVLCKLGGQDVPITGAVAQGQFEGLDQLGVGPVPRTLIGTGTANLECSFDGITANVVSVAFQ